MRRLRRRVLDQRNHSSINGDFQTPAADERLGARSLDLLEENVLQLGGGAVGARENADAAIGHFDTPLSKLQVGGKVGGEFEKQLLGFIADLRWDRLQSALG